MSEGWSLEIGYTVASWHIHIGMFVGWPFDYEGSLYLLCKNIGMSVDSELGCVDTASVHIRTDMSEGWSLEIGYIVASWHIHIDMFVGWPFDYEHSLYLVCKNIGMSVDSKLGCVDTASVHIHTDMSEGWSLEIGYIVACWHTHIDMCES